VAVAAVEAADGGGEQSLVASEATSPTAAEPALIAADANVSVDSNAPPGGGEDEALTPGAEADAYKSEEIFLPVMDSGPAEVTPPAPVADAAPPAAAGAGDSGGAPAAPVAAPAAAKEGDEDETY
jgi:hypothetical protein